MALISLIVPTFNEADNLETLVERVFKTVREKKLDLELVVVDDNSPDGTARLAEKLAKKYPIKVIVRTKDKGLSPAVVEGFNKTDSEIIGVIDADLSHPPEKIPELIKALESADVAVASRLMKGGGVEEWPFSRRLISIGATLLARPLTNCSDPMSGFFFLRRSVIKNAKLNPLGYKILLEILVKGDFKKMSETPYVFQNRTVGKSKLNIRTNIQYVEHLLRLYRFKFFS
jgi:dolichol-phosphate mannosyltransferase